MVRLSRLRSAAIVGLLVAFATSLLCGLQMGEAIGPTLILSTQNIDLGAIEIGLSASTNFTISNGGDGVLIWSVYNNNPYILVAPSTGQTEEEIDQVSLTVNAADLDEGEYETKVFVKSTAWSSVIKIRFSVVQPPVGPISYVDRLLFDGAGPWGNGNGVLEAGERAAIAVQLRNGGTEVARGLTATISTADPYVRVIDGSSPFPDIAPLSTAWCNENFTIEVDALLADGYFFELELLVQDSEGHRWRTGFGEGVSSNQTSILSIQPPSLNFGLVVKGQSKALNLTMSNVGGGILGWKASSDIEWLAISPSTGAAGSQPGRLTARASAGGLTIGSYHEGGVSVLSNGGDLVVPVVIMVGTGGLTPHLGRNLYHLDFGDVEIGKSSTKLLKLFNAGAGTLQWSLIENHPWLHVNCTVGSCTTEVDVIAVTVDASDLQPGDYWESFHIFSTGGNEDFPVRFTAVPPNSPPTVILRSGNQTIFANETVCFDAGNSYDADGYVEAYRFDFGDGESTGWSPDPVACHTYLLPGNYTVRALVRDDDNSTSESELIIKVIRRTHPPVLRLSVSPLVSTEGEALNFSTAGSHDPDGGDIVSFTFVYGDGSNSSGNLSSVLHIYDSPGLYQAMVIGLDDEGEKGQSSLVNITVEQRKPVIVGPLARGSVSHRAVTSYPVWLETTNPSAADSSLSLELLEEEASIRPPEEDWSLGEGGILDPLFELVLNPNETRTISFVVNRSYSWIPPGDVLRDRLADAAAWNSRLAIDLRSGLDALWPALLEAGAPFYPERTFRYSIRVKTQGIPDPDTHRTVTIKADPTARSAFRASVLSSCLAYAGSPLLPRGAWASIIWLMSDNLYSWAGGEQQNVSPHVDPSQFGMSSPLHLNMLLDLLRIWEDMDEGRQAWLSLEDVQRPDYYETAIRVMNQCESAASRIVSVTATVSEALNESDEPSLPGLHEEGKRLLIDSGYDPTIAEDLEKFLKEDHHAWDKISPEILLGQLAKELLNLSASQMQEVLDANREVFGDKPLPEVTINEINRSCMQLDLAFRSRRGGSHIDGKIDHLRASLRELMRTYTDPLLVDFYFYVLRMELILRLDHTPPHVSLWRVGGGEYASNPFELAFTVVDDLDPMPDVSSNVENGTVISQEGVYTFWFYGRDHAGNSRNMSRRVILDTSPPFLVIRTNETTLTVLADDPNLDRMLIHFNGSLVYNSTETSWRMEFSSVDKEATWLLEIVAIDKAGNKAEKKVLVTEGTRSICWLAPLGLLFLLGRQSPARRPDESTTVSQTPQFAEGCPCASNSSLLEDPVCHP